MLLYFSGMLRGGCLGETREAFQSCGAEYFCVIRTITGVLLPHTAELRCQQTARWQWPHFWQDVISMFPCAHLAGQVLLAEGVELDSAS